LEGLSLGRYAQSFADNDIDFDVLPDLTEADLERLGLSLGDRKRVLRAVDRAPGTGQSAPSTVAPLTPTPSAVETQPERRQVTVMFCDLVGSTEISIRLDPEDWRRALRAYQGVCAELIKRFDGFTVQYLGDGILACFGFPHTHEGEAERAVRAGLAILESISQIAAEAGLEPSIRVGIVTGPAVIGHGSGGQIAITGKTPNLAARIQELARPGTLLIAESTRRMIAAQFECEPLGALRPKGISETVQAWRVVRELSEAEQFEAKCGTVAECVGRDRELKLLLDRWRLTTAGVGQAVVVSGEAGVGKSRLVALLREQLPTTTLINVRLQCGRQYRNSPLWPVIVHLRLAADLKADDPPEVKLTKIERLLKIAGSSNGAPLIATLLSVPFDDRYPPLALSPALQRARTLQLLIEQVIGLAALKPVLLVVEDAHWIDPTTEETLIGLMDRLAQYRIMILLTTRPDSALRLMDHPHAMSSRTSRPGRDQTNDRRRDRRQEAAAGGDGAHSSQDRWRAPVHRGADKGHSGVGTLGTR
jgi:class 3 adenylate cyclase